MKLLHLIRRLVRLVQVALDLALLVCLPVALSLLVIHVVEEKVALRDLPALVGGPCLPYTAVLVAAFLSSLLISGFLALWDWTGRILSRKKAE